MTTHVFIVDSTTFKFHLEYLFAGTGAKDKVVDFNNNRSSELHGRTENNLVSMIADANRIREGDLIIFYLQQNFSDGIYDGKFYGIFKARSDWSFLDNNDENQYLKNNLGKSLTFRTLIEPYKVYPKGVTEWEALDEIKHIQSPDQMLWSLIYRKLKGNRGNTMITSYESERLTQLIRDKNDREMLSNPEENLLTYDADNQEIAQLDEPLKEYKGRKTEIKILPRLIEKFNQDKAFEVHLQAYMTKNIGQGTNESLDNTILQGAELNWIGNEVSCGVGMQRMDIMLALTENEQNIVLPIELKITEATPDHVSQIQRYVDWIEQYYIPNHQSDIQPVLVSKKISSKESAVYKNLIEAFRSFNETNSCCDLRHVEFSLKDNKLTFEEIPY